jgi:hypothetical protein
LARVALVLGLAAGAARADDCGTTGAAQCPLPVDLGAALGASATVSGRFTNRGPREWNYQFSARQGETLEMGVARREGAPGAVHADLSCAGESTAMPIAALDNAFLGAVSVGAGEATAQVRVKATGLCRAHVETGVSDAGEFTLTVTRKASEIEPIADMRVLLIGSQTGRLHELQQADGFVDLTKPAPGREAADSYLLDVELNGPANTDWPHADFGIEVYAVVETAPGDRQSRLIARRKVADIAFGPTGVRHEAVFVDRGLCGQVAVYAHIEKPALSGVKALMPFECGR